MKKLLFLLLAIGCAAVAFAGGQGDSAAAAGVQEVSAPGVLPIVKDKVAIDVIVSQHPLVIDYATNEATQWLEEKTNVKVNWETVPSEGREEKINIILASGDLPDVFYGTRINTKQEALYGSEEKLFIPLNNLIDEHGFWFTQALSEFEFDVLGMIKNPDGNIYGLPTLSNCFHCFNSKKMWLNTTWLKNLGLAVPKTTDEFYNVLKAFKDKDANGNGNPNDEYPLVGSTRLWNGAPELFLLNSFLFYPEQGTPFSVIKGKATSVVDTAAYKAGLKYLNKLYSEGLLYEATYTQDANQLNNMTNNPDAAIVGALPAGNIIGSTFKAYERAIQYEGIAPLRGPEGVQYTLYNPYSAVYFGDWVITTECENPAAAFKYADFLFDFESTMRVRYGVLDRDWRYANPDEPGLDGKPAEVIVITPWAGADPRNDNYVWVGPFFESLKLRLGRGVPKGTDPYTQGGLEVLLFNVTSEKMVPYQPKTADVMTPIPVKYTVDESDVLLTLQTEVLNYVNEHRVRFITGDLKIDTEWDRYVSGLKSLGIQTWIDLYQTAYDRQF